MQYHRTKRSKDYYIVSVLGFIIGLLFVPVLKGSEISFFETNTAFRAVFFALGIVLFGNISLAFSFWVGRRFPLFLQLAKYFTAGSLTTLLDLGILNTLILTFGVASGPSYAAFKAFSFFIGSIHSYLINKYWAFASRGPVNAREIGRFYIVALIGLALNVGAASFVVDGIGMPAGISEKSWASIGAFAAVIISIAWNFFGFKYIAFRK